MGFRLLTCNLLYHLPLPQSIYSSSLPLFFTWMSFLSIHHLFSSTDSSWESAVAFLFFLSLFQFFPFILTFPQPEPTLLNPLGNYQLAWLLTLLLNR